MLSRPILSIGIIAAAALLFESTLTRLLAVTQFYHFAFLVVSLALLGYGASGTILSIYPRLLTITLNRLLVWLGMAFAASVSIAYIVINYLPFDSYAIAWDRRQILYFFSYYLVLTLPFIVSGIAVGAAISTGKSKSHLIYAANLFGSGLGALFAPGALWLAGVPGAVLLSGVMGIIAALTATSDLGSISKWYRTIRWISIGVALSGIFVFCVLTSLNSRSRSPLGMVLSPYKGLAQVQRYPEAKTVFSRWNAISRIDVVQNASMHHFPGLSYEFEGVLPEQVGLSVDADALQPITLVQPDEFAAADYLPEKLVFDLRPKAKTLVLEPAGGLGVLQAIAGGSEEVTVVVGNPLVSEAVEAENQDISIYHHPRVKSVVEIPRVFMEQNDEVFDVVFIPLTDSYRPVTSGAYSLGEAYSLTVEAFKAALKSLSSDGVLVVTRWVQVPPSESLRMIATLLDALEGIKSVDVKYCIVSYRGIQTLTTLVKPAGWTEAELDKLRTFVENRKFDLVWAPDLEKGEINRYNRLFEPLYYQAVNEMLSTTNLSGYYRAYPFDITPTTDNHPFFFHFFKWEQTPEVLATIGHIWQPFGGSGYLVTIALLILATILSVLLILLPLAFQHGKKTAKIPKGIYLKALVYFTFLGFAFLFVEIPLIQQSIINLGHPTYAFTTVVFAVLFFSSLGSTLVRRESIPRKSIIVLLAGLASIFPVIFPRLVSISLGWHLSMRVLTILFCIAPLAILMGMPFPAGLMYLEQTGSEIIPWVWAVNGSVSVIASVLAAILALSYGFSTVLWMGACFYTGAAILYVLFIKV